MTFGEKITMIRKENNLTQEQFAEMLNVSRQSVSKWELGISFPDTEKLIRIGKLFSCSLDYLLKDEIESKDVNQLLFGSILYISVIFPDFWISCGYIRDIPPETDN